MAFFIYLIVMVVLTLIADLTRPVPKSPKRPGLGDFTFPTVDSVRKVPVVWGKPLLRGPNLTWWGDLKIREIKKKVKGVFTDKEYTAGYKYDIGLHMAFCVSNGDTRLLKLLVQDELIWSGNLASGRGEVDKGDLFGGEDGEGGIEGDFDWCPGGAAQGQNSYLRRAISGRVPAYRSSARLVWRRGYVGNSKYIKEWAAQVQRLPTRLGSGYHDINGEANPAEMLYELLVEKIWGLGTSSLEIDLATFQASAMRLHQEGFGLSLVWDGSKALSAVRDDILAHIDANMFVNVLTGKWELNLNRPLSQAEIDLLEVYDENSIRELESYSRPSPDETTNEVNVVWTENGSTTQWPAKAQHLGLFQTHEKQFVSVDVTYQGVTSYALAARLATRDLAVLSYPLVKVAFKTNRSAYKMKPGSRFKFSWGPLGLVETVCVVIGIDYGTLDDNEIAIEAVQDIFELGTGLYITGGTSAWIPPSRLPVAPSAWRMEFSPFALMKLDDQIEDPQSAVPILMVEAPNDSHLSYATQYADPTTGSSFSPGFSSQPFTPTAILAHDYLETVGTDGSQTLVLRDLNRLDEISDYSVSDVQFLARGLVVVDSEWMAIRGAVERDDGYFVCSVVHRGLIDSAPARHLAGAKVWFVGEGVGRTPTELSPFAAGVYQARLISKAIGGTASESGSPVASISTNGVSSNARPLYQYPVRDLTLNGSATPGTVAGNLTVAYRARNRATEDKLVFQEDSFLATTEVGAVYRVYLYRHDGTLLASSGDITALTYTFLASAVPGGIPLAGYVQVETWRAPNGAGQRTTRWFGAAVDYAATSDSAPQQLLDEAGPWSFWRMSDQ